MSGANSNFSTDLTGQTAIVTGASAGLGMHFAKLLAAHGASVALAARRKDKLDAVVADITAAGGHAHSFPTDLTDADQLVALVDRATALLGDVTILVNNAGIPDAQLATRMPVALIDAVLDTNIRAPFILSREVAQRLIRAKRPGRIVNLSSIGAFDYGPRSSASLYSTSKAAVARMTETLAMEWVKFGINVNAIAPGAFSSEMMDGMISRVGEVWKDFPRERLGEPRQLDSTLLYLVSPSSDFVTGTCIKVDDGQSRR